MGVREGAYTRRVRISGGLTLLLLAIATAAHAGPNPAIAEARLLAEQLKYEKALKAVAAAREVPGNDRAQVLELLMLEAVLSGALSRRPQATRAFRELLLLDSGHSLPADQPPRVRTAYFEAQAWAAAQGPLQATPEAEVVGTEVKAVQVTISRDVLGLMKRVRFFLQADGPVRTVEAELRNGVARVEVGAPAVSWWVQVLGERDAVLLEVGTKVKALRHEGAPAVVAAPVKPEVVAPPRPLRGWMRPTGYGLLGGAALAGGVGVVLGVLSRQSRSQVAGAEEVDGVVVGLTQAEALALEASGRTQALVANVLFVTAGVLAASGLALVLLGGDDAPTVTVAPTAGGLSLTGCF